MADYDFDHEFDVEEYESPQSIKQKNTKQKPDPYVKRKQSFGIQGKPATNNNNNSGFEAFDIDDEEKAEDAFQKRPLEKKKDQSKYIELNGDTPEKAKKKSEEFVDDFEEDEKPPVKNNQTSKDADIQYQEDDHQTFLTNLGKISCEEIFHRVS